MNHLDGGDIQRLAAWADALPDSNYYEILGVLELADPESIRLAFRSLAAAFHPDCHVGAPPEVLALVERVYRAGAEAYRVLIDPERRGEYDLALARGVLRLSSAPDSLPPESRRPEAVRSLEDLCRSPAARLCARKADAAITEGAYDGARRHLKEAIALDDYDNPELEERLEALDYLHFARGD